MYDACELFETELGLEPKTFFLNVEKDPESIKAKLKNTGLFNQNLLLSEDLHQKGSSAPLLTKGNDLCKNIDSILRKMARDPDSIIRPKIAATDQVNIYLKRKIIKHIQSMKDTVTRSEKYRQIYNTANKRKDLREILNSIGEIVDKFIGMPEVIAAILSALKSKEQSSILEESINAAYISMFTFNNRKGLSQYLENFKEKLIDVGSAALFRNISKIIYDNKYSPEDTFGHSEKSAEIAEGIGINSDVIYAIRNHHNIVLDETKLTPPSEIALLYKDVIVAVDLFIDLTAHKNFAENDVIIGLNTLSMNGYLDKDTIASLGDMYVGKDKNFLIKNGIRLIKEECTLPDKEAFLWNPLAPVPYAIICANLDCKHIGPLFVTTHRNVKSDLDIGVVPKGKYSHCKKLTQALMEGGYNIIGDELSSELSAKLNIKLNSTPSN